MRHRLWGLLGLLGLALALTFPKSTLYVEGHGKRHLLKVEVADTPERWAQGLMFRERLGEDEGMVFLFPEPTAGGFWMKNTLIPLSVAFIDKDGFIINIEEMKPLTLDIHCSKAKAFYALEMNESWFEKNHVKPGDKISRLPQLRQTN